MRWITYLQVQKGFQEFFTYYSVVYSTLAPLFNKRKIPKQVPYSLVLNVLIVVFALFSC